MSNSTTEYTLYTDGGVIGKNPSEIGGTWACIFVRNDNEVVWQKSGILTPCHNIGRGPVVTNNVTELYAILVGILSLPDDITVKVCSDSQVAIGWVFRNNSTARVAYCLVPFLEAVKMKIQRHEFYGQSELIAGHPSQAELERGRSHTGYRVSKWNVWCDNECKRKAEEYLRDCPMSVRKTVAQETEPYT